MARKKCFTQEMELEICKEYELGKSIPQLARKYGVSWSTIWQTLVRWDIQRRTSRKYVFDQSYFQRISTPEQAYWLGFLLADGSLYRSKRFGVELELGASDAKHLEKFREALKTTTPLRYRKMKRSCSLRIWSKKMFDDLVARGLIIRGSAFKPNLPSFLVSHFIRGYYDGDGSLSFDKSCRQWCISFSGTYGVLHWIREQLNAAVGTRRNRLVVDKNSYRLAYKGNRQVPQILGWLYKRATVYLERKYVLAKAILDQKFPN